MSVVTSVTLDSTSITILPGTFEFSAKPVVVRKPNEPMVVTGVNYEVTFEADEDNVSSIDSSSQGTGSSTLTVSGYPTVYEAEVNVSPGGEGIQKRRITVLGTKQST